MTCLSFWRWVFEVVPLYSSLLGRLGGCGGVYGEGEGVDRDIIIKGWVEGREGLTTTAFFDGDCVGVTRVTVR